MVRPVRAVLPVGADRAVHDRIEPHSRAVRTTGPGSVGSGTRSIAGPSRSLVSVSHGIETPTSVLPVAVDDYHAR